MSTLPPLRIAIVQLTSVPGDLPANVETHAALVRKAARRGARVVVFPELSLCGYDLDAIARDPSLTIAPEDDRLRPLTEACRGSGTIAVAGASVARVGRRLLAAVVVDGDGVRDVYAKRYVHDDEAPVFDSGDRDLLVDVDGSHLALAICFDSAHPEHAESYRAAGAAAYLVGAMFLEGEERKLADRMADRARAFGLWVALANHSGPTGDGPACGGSGIWSPGGEAVVQLGKESPALVTAELRGRWDAGASDLSYSGSQPSR